MQKQILWVIEYFSFFNYAPDFNEIYRFLSQKITQKDLTTLLKQLVKQNRLLEKDNRYTPGEYIKGLRKQKERRKISKNKIQRLRLFLRLVSFFPQIEFIGLSGSVAMLNANEGDDIDLFVITARNRLWIGRFISLLLASFFGRRRFKDKNTRDKLCFNLFFDASDLGINSKKRSLYVAHEVLQLKPLIDKGRTYTRFLEANKWVFKFFPNAEGLDAQIFHKNRGNVENLASSYSSLGDIVEKVIKIFQLVSINRHKTTEIITDTQLWFFPDDFEKKIKSAGLIH